MSEEINKSVVQQDLAKLEGFLEDYEAKIGLTKFGTSDVSKYLTIDQQGLKMLSPEECGEAAYLLNQEAMYIQHELNKYQAQMDWANARINRSIAADLNNHGGRFATFETRQILAVKSNSYAKELQGIVDKAQRIITRLSYLPNRLKDLANVLLDYRHSKMRSE